MEQSDQKIAVLKRPAFRKWTLLALVFTLTGLLNFILTMIGAMGGPGNFPWKSSLFREFASAYGILILLPVTLPFLARYPIERGKRTRRIPLHILACVLFGAAHTSLMWLIRQPFSNFAGWEWSSYTFLGNRFLMEGIRQIFSYWCVLFVFEAIRYARMSREKELVASKLERELVTARLSALKMQLNPHFLFNTLNMISSDIEHSPRRADMTLHHLSDFLRITLHGAPVQEVPLEKEIELLDAYLEIMKARFEDRLAVMVSIPEETGDVLVPHLILQPLVENSITQCMSDFSRQGRIRIASSLTDGRLRILIEDNGPGLSVENDSVPAQGIGLSNTTERLRHLYGKSQKLELSNRPEGGLSLLIEIPRRHAYAWKGRKK